LRSRAEASSSQAWMAWVPCTVRGVAGGVVGVDDADVSVGGVAGELVVDVAVFQRPAEGVQVERGHVLAGDSALAVQARVEAQLVHDLVADLGRVAVDWRRRGCGHGRVPSRVAEAASERRCSVTGG
jgi:hypothetical protein